MTYKDEWREVTADEFAEFERANPHLKRQRINFCEPAAWHLFDQLGQSHARIWLFEEYPKDAVGYYGPNVHELRELVWDDQGSGEEC